jgi:hypothetical protein
MTHGLRSGRRPIAAAAAVLFITGALLLVALGGARQVGATAHHDHAVTATATATATAKATATARKSAGGIHALRSTFGVCFRSENQGTEPIDGQLAP